jgi:hypothetical protein
MAALLPCIAPRCTGRGGQWCSMTQGAQSWRAPRVRVCTRLPRPGVHKIVTFARTRTHKRSQIASGGATRRQCITILADSRGNATVLAIWWRQRCPFGGRRKATWQTVRLGARGKPWDSINLVEQTGSEYQRNIQFSKPNGSARLSLLGYQTWKEEDGAATLAPTRKSNTPLTSLEWKSCHPPRRKFHFNYLSIPSPFPFPFPFCVAALTLSRPMGRVISSSVTGSLEEIRGSGVDEPTDFALHLGWCLTTSHQWKRLNSEPLVLFLHCSFLVSRTMALSALLYLQEASWL